MSAKFTIYGIAGMTIAAAGRTGRLGENTRGIIEQGTNIGLDRIRHPKITELAPA